MSWLLQSMIYSLLYYMPMPSESQMWIIPQAWEVGKKYLYIQKTNKNKKTPFRPRKSTIRTHCLSYCTFHNTNKKKSNTQTKQWMTLNIYIYTYAMLMFIVHLVPIRWKRSKSNFLTSPRNVELLFNSYVKYVNVCNKILYKEIGKEETHRSQDLIIAY